MNIHYELIEYSAFVGLILLSLIFALVFIVKEIFPGKRFRYAMPISNLIVLTAILLLRMSTDDALADMIWSIPLKLVFILFFMRETLSQFLGIFHSRILIPFVTFGLVGSAQYYVLGLLCDYLLGKSVAWMTRQISVIRHRD